MSEEGVWMLDRGNECSADQTVQSVKVQEVHSHLACGGSSYRYLQLPSGQLLRAIALNDMKSVRGHHTAMVGHWSVTHDNMEFVGVGVDEIRWDPYLIMIGIVEHRSCNQLQILEIICWHGPIRVNQNNS